ncbi:MAG TPA: type VI secretion system baseplate subunit TssK [Bryobacteraceae bacterium]|nr:type VI secretion system baseplate subunit TssK [Bryobacteraceae bacterium]
MKHAHRVVWSKGMFLTPQHFQAQDEYFEDQIQFRASASSSANWGLTGLAIDQEALTNGVFTVRHCRGILSDGLTFNIPETDEPPPGREIAPAFAPTDPEIDVFLAVPEQRSRGKNVTVPSGPNGRSEAGTRYIASSRLILDETGGVEEKPIQVANKNFRLVFGGESLDGTSFVRIARVTRSPAGTYIVRGDFVPPALSIDCSDYLLLMLRRLIELLAAKAGSLANLRRQKGRSLADFGPGDLANFWLLHTVNTWLPPLKHLWMARRRHPELMYVTMLELAGALCTFSLDEQARSLPDYDHENLGRCFTELDEKIRALLETAIPSRCIVVPLVLTEKSIWSAEIKEEQYFKKTQFMLSVSAQMGVDDVVKQAPKLMKVSPPAEIHRLIRNALPGVTLRHAPVPPAAVPVRLDRQYFTLNQSGILWDGIVKSQQLSVFVPDEIARPEMELLIVLLD